MPFVDRMDAGARLAARLPPLRVQDVVVLGLLVGASAAHGVARALGAPSDVIVVRTPAVPFRPEPVTGAVGEDGVLPVVDGIATGPTPTESTRDGCEPVAGDPFAAGTDRR